MRKVKLKGSRDDKDGSGERKFYIDNFYNNKKTYVARSYYYYSILWYGCVIKDETTAH